MQSSIFRTNHGAGVPNQPAAWSPFGTLFIETVFDFTFASASGGGLIRGRRMPTSPAEWSTTSTWPECVRWGGIDVLQTTLAFLTVKFLCFLQLLGAHCDEDPLDAILVLQQREGGVPDGTERSLHEDRTRLRSILQVRVSHLLQWIVRVVSDRMYSAQDPTRVAWTRLTTASPTVN